MAKMDLTPEVAREMLNYDPVTGAFTWKSRGRGNARRIVLGKPAGRVSPSTGYHDIGLCGRLHRAHRLAWLIVHGVWPTGVVDHIDGNPLNNRLNNLRDVSHATNMQNMKVRKDSSTGVAGVYKKGNRFRAAIVLGTFDTAEEAREVYKHAKQLFHAGYVA